MSKKIKLQKILKALSPDETAVDFSQFDQQIGQLKESLKEKITVKTLDDVNNQLEKFRKRLDLNSLIEKIDEVQIGFLDKVNELKTQFQDKLNELNKLVAKTESEDSVFYNETETSIVSLKSQLFDLEEKRINDVQSLETKLSEIGLVKSEVLKLNKTLNETVSNLEQSDAKTAKEITKEVNASLETVRKELLRRINNIGGGAQNQRIQVNGTTMSTKYADINLIGPTAADNNTTKQVDITFAQGASIGGAVTSGTAGSVLFVNPTGILAQDNANLFWDATNHRLGIGTTNPNVFAQGAGNTYLAVENASSQVQLNIGTTNDVGAGGTSARLRFYNSRADLARASINMITNAANSGRSELTFMTGSGSGGDTERWRIDYLGNLLAGTDNSWDIGASGATRPRTGYFGTSVVTPEVDVKGANAQTTKSLQATVLSGAMSGATLTLTNLIPAGSMVIGVTIHPTTTITSGDGATTYNVGDGTDPDRWGANIVFANDVTLADITIASPVYYTAATNVVLTANAGTFSAGVVRVTVHYITLTAPTS